MRALVIALCCAGVILTLQGCGSTGSKGSKTTCLASQFEIKSQSISASLSGSVSIHIEANDTTVTTTMPLSGQIKEMLDLEQFNFYAESSQDISMNMPVPGGQPSVQIDMHVETKSILIAADKKAVTYNKVTNNTDQKTISEICQVHTLEQLPPPAALSSLFEQAMAMLRQLMTCGGNDGTYDTWKIDKAYSGPIPNIPGMPKTDVESVEGSVSGKVVMTKDGLLHSTSEQVHAKETDEDQKVPFSMDVNTEMTVSAATMGGPSQSDLDYSTWGKCDPAVHEVEVDHLFDGPVAAVQLQQTYLQQHVLSTIKVGMTMQTKTVQPVVV